MTVGAAAAEFFTHHIILFWAHVELGLTWSKGSFDLKEPFQRSLGLVSVKKSGAHNWIILPATYRLDLGTRVDTSPGNHRPPCSAGLRNELRDPIPCRRIQYRPSPVHSSELRVRRIHVLAQGIECCFANVAVRIHSPVCV